MIHLYGNPASTCTRKVLMTLAETGTPYELTVIDLAKGEHKQPAHLGRQPFGQIPAIDDDGFSFFESRAICRYINEKSGGKLIPQDLQGRALAEQWVSVESANFTPHAMRFVYHYVFKRPQDPAVLEQATRGLETALAVMDARLAKTPYFAGRDFSLADVVFMPYLEYLMATPAKELVAKYTHVASWWGRVSERPTWLKTVGRG